MITHSNKKCWGGEWFLKSNGKGKKEVVEKKIVPGEAFITGKRAYVFDGVKII